MSHSAIVLSPRDSYHRRVYIAPLGLHIVSDAGTLESVTCLIGAADEAAIVGVSVTFSDIGAQPLRNFRLRLLTRSGKLTFKLDGGFPESHGAYVIAPQAGRRGSTVNVTWT